MEESVQLAEKAFNLAKQYEGQKGHCSQCTLVAIMETLGDVDSNLVKAADGLTGGTVMSTQGTCGALAAGIMAISRYKGRSYQAFTDGGADHTWEYVQKLYTTFVEKYGSPIGCNVQKKIFGRCYDLQNPEERKMFEDAGAHVDKCPFVCADVASWTVSIISEMDRSALSKQEK